MAFGPFTLSGEGHQAFGTGALVIVTDVDVEVTAFPPKARQVGAEAPFGLWHAGWWAIGISPDDASGFPDRVICYQHFIKSTREDHFIPNARIDIYVGTLFYKLVNGVSINLTIYTL